MKTIRMLMILTKSLCKQFEQEAIRKSQLPVIHANVNLSVQE